MDRHCLVSAFVTRAGFSCIRRRFRVVGQRHDYWAASPFLRFSTWKTACGKNITPLN
jgi:hypothetical protein